MFWKIEKKNYEIYTKILFRCSNINMYSPLSPNRLKLEKQPIKILSFHSEISRKPSTLQLGIIISVL